jgi:streptomycin 6-kinase
MTTTYDHEIPVELVTHTMAICGEPGRDWLSELPIRIAELENKWAITVLAPFPAIEFNFVAPAVKDNGEQVVVKIAPPYDNLEATSEIKYLRTLNGHGTVRLLAEEPRLAAILLERAVPGENLSDIFAGHEPKCLLPAIDVLTRLQRPVPPDSRDAILLADWFGNLRRYKTKQFPTEYGEKALDLYDNVLRHQQDHYLHGDFHPANIVSAQRSPYLAIDPKGIVGPNGYDIAVFLNNYHWWQETRTDIRQRLDDAVRQFAEAFGIDALHLRQWAFAQMILSAWWTFDEMPEIYNNDAAKADIWDI